MRLRIQVEKLTKDKDKVPSRFAMEKKGGNVSVNADRWGTGWWDDQVVLF